MYDVIIAFADLVDGGTYQKGMTYPQEGKKPTTERIAYLMGDQNKLGAPVIAEKPKAKEKPQE